MNHIDYAKLVEVIEVDVLKGTGTEVNPYRRVKQYWSKAGELLAERDNYLPYLKEDKTK
jgi:hypothetical protein